MANDINIVVAAQVQGAIRPLQQVQQQVRQVDSTINRSTAALRQNANQYNRSAVSLNKFAKGALQQAGYQIGDYAVQVANGTSAMQAFGQQGAQMLGVFGPVGAVLGAAVAIFSAVAVAAEKSGKEVSNFGSVFGQLQEPLTATVDAVRGLAASFGSVMPFVVNNIDTAIIAGGILAAVFGVKMVAGMIASAGASKIMTVALATFRAGLVAARINSIALSSSIVATTTTAGVFSGAIFAASAGLGRISFALGAARAAVMTLGAALKAVGAIMMRFLPVALLLGVAKLVEMFLQLKRGAGSLGDAIGLVKDVFVEAFGRIKLVLSSLGARISSVWSGMKGDALLAIQGVVDNLTTFANNTANTFEGVYNAVVAIWDDLPDAFKRLGAIAMNNLVDVVESGTSGITDALNNIITLGGRKPEWAIESIDLTKWRQAVPEATNLGQKMSAAFDKAFEDSPFKTGIDLNAAAAEALTVSNAMDDAARTMMNAATAPLSSWQRLKEAFGAGATEVNIFGAASEEALGKTGKAAKDVQEKISDLRKSIEGSMESAFMSIIDGTKSVKDAFRSMASEIIKELYRVFVVQRLVGMISNAVGGFFNMNQVSGPRMPLGTGNVRPPVRPSFAGGGYTGMGSRSGGVDGRGGFPAILHPNETVVDHSAGQGMGTVVVNQTINISTGVQQTVRTEIKQLMPQIAESAKQAVVDAKRRGGSYGRAFA